MRVGGSGRCCARAATGGGEEATWEWAKRMISAVGGGGAGGLSFNALELSDHLSACWHFVQRDYTTEIQLLNF